VHVFFFKNPLDLSVPTLRFPQTEVSVSPSLLFNQNSVCDGDEIEHVGERACGKKLRPITSNINTEFLRHGEPQRHPSQTIERRDQCSKPSTHARAVLRGFAALDVDVRETLACRWWCIGHREKPWRRLRQSKSVSAGQYREEAALEVLVHLIDGLVHRPGEMLIHFGSPDGKRLRY